PSVHWILMGILILIYCIYKIYSVKICRSNILKFILLIMTSLAVGIYVEIAMGNQQGVVLAVIIVYPIVYINKNKTLYQGKNNI
ncbi:unnamed protein product, partial [marine sediment metagenome]